MKTLAIILIFISTLGYSQRVEFNDLNKDSLSFYIVEYMNHARDSLIPKYKYEVNTRYNKRTKKLQIDTISSTLITHKKYSIDNTLILASDNQLNYIYKVNHITHFQTEYDNGIKVDVDTILKDHLARGEYFNINIESEVCLETGYGYDANGYYNFITDDLSSTQIYKLLAKSIIDLYLKSKYHKLAILNVRYNKVGISTGLKDGAIYNVIVFN